MSCGFFLGDREVLPFRGSTVYQKNKHPPLHIDLQIQRNRVHESKTLDYQTQFQNQHYAQMNKFTTKRMHAA